MIVGVDVGLANLGWCAVKGNEVVAGGTTMTKRMAKVSVAESCALRAQILFKRLFNYIADLEEEPEIVLCELPHGGSRSARAARAMGIAIGTVAGVMTAGDWPFAYIDNKQAKIAAEQSGFQGPDSKTNVAAWVQTELIWPEDFFGVTKTRRHHMFDAAGVVLVYQKAQW